MDIPILFEDADVLVVNKPSGVVVNRSDTASAETVQDWAETHLKDQISKIKEKSARTEEENAFLTRSGIVHRLDKETSGCLLIAKDPRAFANLQRQFKDRTVKKEYLALVHGVVEPREGVIRVPLARSPVNRQKFTVSAGGRAAETGWVVEHMFTHSGEQLTLVRLFPKTGRTHQIRVHMNYFGHPLVSDLTYGGRRRSGEDRVWCPRMFLHAASIEFTNPGRASETSARVHVDAQLPSDLAAVLSSL